MSTPFTTFKRGVTFSAFAPYVAEAGDPVDLSTFTITSAFRDRLNRVTIATVVKAVDNMSFTVSVPAAQTELWQTGEMKWDVRFTVSSVTITKTQVFTVEDRITPP